MTDEETNHEIIEILFKNFEFVGISEPYKRGNNHD